MNREQVLIKVSNCVKEILEYDDFILYDHTQANEIEGWDSLSHIQIVVEIESAFDIRFSFKEVKSFKNIGEMVDTILKKIES